MAEGDSGFNLGSAYAAIIIDASGVTDGIAKARRAFDAGILGMTQALQRFGAQLTVAGLAVEQLTKPLKGFIEGGVHVAASFEDVMTQIKVFGGVTGAELETVRRQVLKWGADTVFSAQDAGEAMLSLLKAGVSVKDATAAMPAVLQLATVGNMSLAQSSQIVTQAMAQYGLQAKDAGRITDALAQGANASLADVSDLGQALANVGPIARQYGLSIEDTTAILAVFANNGIRGAEAGTQLRSMLTHLSSPTKASQKAWQQLGVSLYDAQGKLRPFAVVIKDIAAKMKDMTPKQQNEILKALGGAYGQLGLSALVASDGIDTMQKTMKAAPGGAAVEAASVGTFNRALENLRGSIETLQIQVLTPFMDNVLKPLVNQLISIVNQMTDWAQRNPALANTLLMIAVAVSGLGPVLFAAGIAISALGTVLAAVGGVLAFILSPIGLVIAALALLAAAFVNNWGGIRDVITNAWGQIAPVLEQIRQWFVGQVLPQIVAFVQGTVLPAIQKFFLFLGNAWAIIEPTLINLWNWFQKDALPAILDFITKTALPAIEDFIKVLIRIWDDVSPKLLELLKWFTQTALPAIGDFIQNQAMPVFDKFITVLKDIWTTVQPALKSLFDWFSANGLPLINNALTFFKLYVLDPAIGSLKSIWSVAEPALKAIHRWFVENMPQIQTAIRGVVDQVTQFITQINVALQLLNQLKTGQAPSGHYEHYKPGEGIGLKWVADRDSGGPGMAGLPYLIRPTAGPELFIPQTSGTFIPNIDKLLAGNSGMHFAAGAIVINAGTYEGGRAAGQGFVDELNEWRARRG